MTPKELIKRVSEDIRDGKLASLAPLISLFVMAGKALTLKGREPLLPFFKTILPKRVTGMFGRQVSKSWSTAETSIFKAGMVPGMNTLIIEPRFEQKKRFNDQILKPLLNGFKLHHDIIGKENKESIELKTFKNGNYLMLGNSYSSADSIRGTSGVSTLYVDECVLSTSLVSTYDDTNDSIKYKKIADITAGDIILSFSSDNTVLWSCTETGAKYRGCRSCFRATTISGRVLECTEGHIIPTDIGNIRFRDLLLKPSRGIKRNKDVTIQPVCEITRVRSELTVKQDDTAVIDSINSNTCYYKNRSLVVWEKGIGLLYDPIASIEYIGEHDVYDLEVVGTHNFVLANGICAHNCQDINPDFLPVIEATTDASVDFGLINYFGTAKTSDGTLAMLFEQSSQGHWCIKCEGCGKYNIASPDEQLFKMIGKKGCICAFCGKLLPFFTGGYVHKYPERMSYHAGYHTPQIVFYIHCGYENKWNDILHKMNTWTKTLFYNEVLGIPDDESTRILTLQDLIKAQNALDGSIARALEARRAYDFCVLGVDWSGGGGGASTTAVSVIGKRPYTTVTDSIYMHRFKQGMSAEEEADMVADLARQFKVNYIAHDFTGAGWVREALLVSRHPEWLNSIFPVSYCYKPNADMVSFQQSGSRRSYSVDKTKSLLLTLTAVKHRQLSVPQFNPVDDAAIQRDLLAIVEHPQELNKGSNIYLLERAPGRSDDGAHALNIGFMCACTVTQTYPVFGVMDKYNMTEEQIFDLIGPQE